MDTLALFSSQGKLGKGIQNPLYPDFCIALLGDRPEILSGRPLSNYNKAMSHEEGRTAQHGFLPLHSGGLWTPLPYFPLRENWARVIQILYTPISA